jgi:hypothetical protein
MNTNRLLLWLSAKAYGSWVRYKAALDELVLNAESETREDSDQPPIDEQGFPIYHRVRQNLERLGHAEFFRKDFPSGWRVVPAILATRSYESRSVGILCGARTDELMSRIVACSSDLSVEITAQPECPDRVQVFARTQSELQQLANRDSLSFQPDAPEMLLAAVPPIDDYQLRKSSELPFGSEWDVRKFSTTTLGWTAATARTARQSTFGLFRFSTPFQPQYYLKLKGSAFRLPVQVGKYIAIRKARRSVLSYCADSKTLSMPVSCRPPLLIDRALTLCSGLIPDLDAGSLKYGNIDNEIALTTFELLRQ